MDNMSNFGERLKDLIIENKIDVETLSKETGFPTYEIYHWRQGKYLPSVVNLIKLADYFKVTADYILGIDITSRADTFKSCPLFKERFAFIIEDKNTNIHKIHKASGVDRNTMYSWLKGEHKPQVDALIKIATALDVTVDYLIGREK